MPKGCNRPTVTGVGPVRERSPRDSCLVYSLGSAHSYKDRACLGALAAPRVNRAAKISAVTQIGRLRMCKKWAWGVVGGGGDTGGTIGGGVGEPRTGIIYTTITMTELGPKRPSPLWFLGPNSIIVVYMDPLGKGTLRARALGF